jgi:hypothetical protein
MVQIVANGKDALLGVSIRKSAGLKGGATLQDDPLFALAAQSSRDRSIQSAGRSHGLMNRALAVDKGPK